MKYGAIDSACAFGLFVTILEREYGSRKTVETLTGALRKTIDRLKVL